MTKKPRQMDLSERQDFDPETGELRPYPYLNAKGQEVLDPVPMAPPVLVARKARTAAQEIAETVRAELLRQQRLRGVVDDLPDDYDEDDHEIADPEDAEYLSPYEERVIEFLRSNPPPVPSPGAEEGGKSGGPPKPPPRCAPR